jgi:hypothetical protein
MLRYENPDGTGTVEVVVESRLDPADRIDPSLARRG